MKCRKFITFHLLATGFNAKTSPAKKDFQGFIV